MANNSEENKPSEGEGATAAGMVEAVTQNVELIVDRVMDTAEGAVVAVQEKLGMRKPPRRAKPAKPKAKAAAKPSQAAKPKASKAVKAKPSKIAKSVKAKPAKLAKPAKSTKPSKAKKRR